MVIELKKNGDIDVKKLTVQELDTLTDIRLGYHKRELDKILSANI